MITTTCLHKRMRSVVVFLEPTFLNQLPVAVMTISCEECGAPFEFVGVEGGSGVILSPDRRELRLAIAETAKGMVQ